MVSVALRKFRPVWRNKKYFQIFELISEVQAGTMQAPELATESGF